jgi:UDP-N-acetylmuramate--alanine ligase
VRLQGKVEPRYVANFSDMPDAIAEQVRDGDIVLTMGAGSVGGLPAKLIALAQSPKHPVRNH